MTTEKKALMVYHRFPDAEVIASDSLLRLFPEILAALGYACIGGMKFINSGPLRYEDWKEFGTTNAERLVKEHNAVFVDCGYSKTPWDQHRQTNCRTLSSIGRLIEDAADAGADVSWLSAFVDVIEGNDLTAEQMANVGRKDYDSRWPNVALHFRNFLTGLNLVHRDNPERVLKLGNMACNAVLKCLRSELEAVEPTIQALIDEFNEKSEPCLATPVQLEKWRARYENHYQLRLEIEKNLVKNLFAWSRLLPRVRKLYADHPQYVSYFEQQAELAFAACQREWGQACKDACSDKLKVINNVQIDPVAFGIENMRRPAGRENLLNVQIGYSKSIWFGKVLRLRNKPETKDGQVVRPAPFSNLPEKHGSDVAIQFFADGPQGIKFLLSSRKGITLQPLAFWLRRGDLRKRYHLIETQDDERTLMLQVGDEEDARELLHKLRYRANLSGEVETGIRGRRLRFFKADGFSSDDILSVAQQVERHGGTKAALILTGEAVERLRSGGENEISMPNCRGDMVSVPVLYFADFLSSFGNAHNTNPDSFWSLMTPEEVVGITLYAMRETARQAEEQEGEEETAAGQVAC
jgi:hypothetical protein